MPNGIATLAIMNADGTIPVERELLIAVLNCDQG